MKDAKIWKILGYSLSALLLLELVVGIANALLKVPIPISLLHTTLASSITGPSHLAMENFSLGLLV